MATLSDTALTDKELSKLADLFPGTEYLQTATYFGIDRVTALNISHNLRQHSHSVTTDYLTRWRNRNQDGVSQVRQKLVELLDTISGERGWFSRPQYDFLIHEESTMSVQESTSSATIRGSSSSNRRSGNSSSRRSNNSNHNIATSQGPRPFGEPIQPGAANFGTPQPINIQRGPEIHAHMYPGMPPPVVLQYQPIPYPPIQSDQNQSSQKDYRLLNKVANRITDWDEFRTLGLELECSSDDVARLQSENNQSVRTASYKILVSWYERTVRPDNEKWTMLKNALVELQKDKCIIDLGIDELCREPQVELRGSGDAHGLPAASSQLSSLASHPVSQSDERQMKALVQDFAVPEPVLREAPNDPLPSHDVPMDESQTPVKTVGHEDPSTVEQLKKHLERTSEQMMNFPRGIPISKRTEALAALSDSNFLDYGWLNLDSLKFATCAMSETNKPVVVAILDTGIYTDHKDLVGVIRVKDEITGEMMPREGKVVVKSFNFVSDSPDVPLKAFSEQDLEMDHFGHGTMVAGLIKHYGPVNLKILNYKVLPTQFRIENNTIKDVTRPQGKLEDVVAALNHISELDGTEDQVDIINMSFGHVGKIDSLGEKLHDMTMKKVLIAAAGNEGERSVDTVQWPAKYDSVISVGACKDHGGLLEMSARGRRIDFLCPGKHVLSTVGKMLTPDSPDHGHFVTNGTSFSAAFATAVAANVLAASNERPFLTNTSFMRDFLSKMSRDYPRFEVDKGYGILKPAEFFENDMAGLNRILLEVKEGK